jgi:hypothetical protein
MEQLIMMNDGNGSVGASGTGPSVGHTFMFLFLFTSFIVWLTGNKMEYICHLFLFLYSWIKFNKNLPNFLTIQKPDRQFSVRGFAAALKLEPFNATFLQEVVCGDDTMVDCYEMPSRYTGKARTVCFNGGELVQDG